MMIASRRSVMLSVRRSLLALHVLFAVVTGSLMLVTSSTALASDIVDFQIWENVTARGNFGSINPENPDLKKWLWWGEIQMRYRDSGQELNQMLIRPGIGYALTEHSTVFFGYAHVTNYPPVGELIMENRIWQQYQWKGPTPLGAFTTRSRLEERWQDNGNQNNGGDDTGLRFRELLKFNWPFSFHPALSFVMANEVFVNLNSTNWGPPTAKQGLDQNRGFAGFGYRFTPIILMELGYMNQYINRPTKDSMNNILSINFYLDF
jgi:Protein of unknown function (DUF2490)